MQKWILGIIIAVLLAGSAGVNKAYRTARVNTMRAQTGRREVLQ